MLENIFANSPTVGSHDANPVINELNARIQDLEKRLAVSEEKSRYVEQEKKPKIKWGKFRKFFKDVIAPILTFIPSIINAISRFKGATA